MTIQELAAQLIESKARAEEAEREYTSKRDLMYNALAHQPGKRFECGGFKFIRTDGGTVTTVTKQTVIEALLAENIPQEALDRIIGAALVESERWGGLRILRTEA